LPKYVLLVHNHPDGCKRVSVEDMNMTIRADMILDNMGIKLIDHIIVSDDEYISVKVTVFNIEEETGKGWEEQYESYVE
jgi:DNA repair protein RadC